MATNQNGKYMHQRHEFSVIPRLFFYHIHNSQYEMVNSNLCEILLVQFRNAHQDVSRNRSKIVILNSGAAQSSPIIIIISSTSAIYLS